MSWPVLDIQSHGGSPNGLGSDFGSDVTYGEYWKVPFSCNCDPGWSISTQTTEYISVTGTTYYDYRSAESGGDPDWISYGDPPEDSTSSTGNVVVRREAALTSTAYPPMTVIVDVRKIIYEVFTGSGPVVFNSQAADDGNEAPPPVSYFSVSSEVIQSGIEVTLEVDLGETTEVPNSPYFGVVMTGEVPGISASDHADDFFRRGPLGLGGSSLRGYYERNESIGTLVLDVHQPSWPV